MSRRMLVVPFALALAACATSAAPPPATDAGPLPRHAEPGGPTPAGWAVSIVGTPFALGFKAAVCTASLVIAAPIAGLLTLHPGSSYEGLEILGDGIANNCGPPYVVSPYAAS